VHLTITRNYGGTDAALRERLVATEQRLRTKYRVDTQWIDDSTMTIGAPGVRGRLTIGGGTLAVDLDLSVMLLPLRPRIESQLGKELDAVVHD
jgi:putative polyhydroxyalkanoate system protein